ncbi:DegT/DnrJ/EryC1/StrS family aminotransferase [Planctomycetota bacterium]
MDVYLSRPDITEKEINAVNDVLRCPNLSLGPLLPRFENALATYLDMRRAVAVNSGTSALFLSLQSLGIGTGDEVITTPFSFISSTTSIMMTDAKPVFVDIDPNSLNMDPEAIQAHITEKTKAILPVEVFGNPTGMDRIHDIASQYNLPIIEDSCEALGSSLHGKKAGTFGHMSTFAFYPNKQITTGEGGMILTNDDSLADLCVSLRNQGRGENGTWLSHERLGYNFRLSDINCALGLAQLTRIEEIKAKRAQVAQWYQQRLSAETRLELPQIPPECSMSWFVFVVRLVADYTRQQRDTLISLLAQRGIQASNYFPPIHLQPFIAERYGYRSGEYPITESIANRTLALPFYNKLGEDKIDYVCSQLRLALDEL